MSQRVYTGRQPERGPQPGPVAAALPWLLAVAAIAAQIAYPLTPDDRRTSLVVATVLLFAAASTAHLLVHKGAGAAGWYLLVTAGLGLLAEVVGTRTGYPFGPYAYTDALGPLVLGVPWVIPLAWAMLAYPALVAARTLVSGFGAATPSVLAVPLLGALALASWDLFLDPMMVDAGYWSFDRPTPALPGVPGIPLTNFGGWLVTSFVIMLLLDRLPRRTRPAGQPTLLYLWTYASSVLGNAVFFDRPWVAVWGGVVMGLVAVPFAWVSWRDRA